MFGFRIPYHVTTEKERETEREKEGERNLCTPLLFHPFCYFTPAVLLRASWYTRGKKEKRLQQCSKKVVHAKIPFFSLVWKNEDKGKKSLFSFLKIG